MTHFCHATNCEKEITPSFLMCPQHWWMVPVALWRAVWKHYRPGQEVDKMPSPEYLAAMKAAIEVVAVLELAQTLAKAAHPDRRS